MRAAALATRWSGGRGLEPAGPAIPEPGGHPQAGLPDVRERLARLRVERLIRGRAELGVDGEPRPTLALLVLDDAISPALEPLGPGEPLADSGIGHLGTVCIADPRVDVMGALDANVE